MSRQAPDPWIQAVLEQHERSLVAYAARITGDVERARDVVQETFLRLLRADRKDIEARVTEWLFTVCRNRALDTLAKEKPMRPIDPVQVKERTAPDTDPSRALEEGETLLRIDVELERLPEAQREVIELKFRHGLSYRSISEVTRHSIGHVGWLLHHGIKTLRLHMASESAQQATEAKS
jgi:RNA polymerase sigma factor (sigma-70 family)